MLTTEEGFEERGFLKGKLEGIREGILQGKLEGRRENATRLLHKGSCLDEVASLLELSVEETLALKPSQRKKI